MSNQGWEDVRESYSLYLSISYTADTAYSYLHNVGAFVKAVGEPSQVTHEDVVRWYAGNIKNLHRNTARVRLMAVRCFYVWFVNRGGIAADPTAGIKTRQSVEEPTRAFTKGELKRLLKAAETRQELAFLLMFIHSGARRREVLGMSCEDIDWRRGEVLIKKGKGMKERVLAPGPETMQALSALLMSRRKGPVWLSKRGTPMARTTASAYLDRIAERAGVVSPSFHRLRTSFADRFLEKDGSLDELQEIFGHSHISVTAHYAKRSRRTRALGRQRELASRFTFRLPLKIPDWLSPIASEHQKSALRRAEKELREEMDARRRGDSRVSPARRGGERREVVS